MKWSLIVCSCCDTKMPILALCQKDRGVKVTEIESLSQLELYGENSDARHRIRTGQKLEQKNIECSVCGQKMLSLIICFNCIDEFKKMMEKKDAS